MKDEKLALARAVLALDAKMVRQIEESLKRDSTRERDLTIEWPSVRQEVA